MYSRFLHKMNYFAEFWYSRILKVSQWLGEAAPITSFGDLLLLVLVLFVLQTVVWRSLSTANSQKDDFNPAELSTGWLLTLLNCLLDNF